MSWKGKISHFLIPIDGRTDRKDSTPISNTESNKVTNLHTLWCRCSLNQNQKPERTSKGKENGQTRSDKLGDHAMPKKSQDKSPGPGSCYLMIMAGKRHTHAYKCTEGKRWMGRRGEFIARGAEKVRTPSVERTPSVKVSTKRTKNPKMD